MRRRDARVYVIAGLAVIAAGLGFYNMLHHRTSEQESIGALFSSPADPSPERIRTMIDTTAQALGIPKKYIARRNGIDSGRVLPESVIGVPAVFDELRLIKALADSLRPAGFTVAAAKNFKEKTTTIRCRDRDHTCIYRCILYRKELPLSVLKKK